MTLRDRIEDKLDELIINDPTSFPAGEDFINTLEDFLKYQNLEDWQILPWHSDGFKLFFTINGKEESITRNADGGRT